MLVRLIHNLYTFINFTFFLTTKQQRFIDILLRTLILPTRDVRATRGGALQAVMEPRADASTLKRSDRKAKTRRAIGKLAVSSLRSTSDKPDNKLDVTRDTSPDTVIQSSTRCEPEVSSKNAQSQCLACTACCKKCPACVFHDVKSGNSVDKTVLVEAIQNHEFVMGAYNMALVMKKAETDFQFQKILMHLRNMLMNLDLLTRITDNTLKYTGDNGISALLHNYRVQLDMISRNAGEICNISLDATKNSDKQN